MYEVSYEALNDLKYWTVVKLSLSQILANSAMFAYKPFHVVGMIFSDVILGVKKVNINDFHSKITYRTTHSANR